MPTVSTYFREVRSMRTESATGNPDLFDLSITLIPTNTTTFPLDPYPFRIEIDREDCVADLICNPASISTITAAGLFYDAAFDVWRFDVIGVESVNKDKIKFGSEPVNLDWSGGEPEPEEPEPPVSDLSIERVSHIVVVILD